MRPDRTRTLEQADLWSTTITPLARRGAWIPHGDGLGLDTSSRIEKLKALFEDMLRLCVAFALARTHEELFEDPAKWGGVVREVLPDLVQPALGKRVAVVSRLTQARERAAGWELSCPLSPHTDRLAALMSICRRKAHGWKIYDRGDHQDGRAPAAGAVEEVDRTRLTVQQTLQLLVELRNNIDHHRLPDEHRPEAGTAIGMALEALIRSNTLLSGDEYHLVAVVVVRHAWKKTAHVRGVCLRGGGGLLLRGGEEFELKSRRVSYLQSHLSRIVGGDIVLLHRRDGYATLVSPFAMARIYTPPARATQVDVLEGVSGVPPKNQLLLAPTASGDPLEKDGPTDEAKSELYERFSEVLPSWREARARPPSL